MSWKFFNIAKANTEIDRLETDLATLQSAQPTDLAQKMAEVISSNETISARTVQMESDLTTARASIVSLTTSLETAQQQVNTLSGTVAAVTSDLDAALAAFKLDVKADASARDKIGALRGAAVTVLARQGIDASALPATAAGLGGGKSDIIAQLQAISDPVARARFYQTNAAHIPAAHRLTVRE